MNRSWRHGSVVKRTQVWFPVPIWWLTIICNSSFEGSDAFWSLRALGTYMVQINTLANTLKT